MKSHLEVASNVAVLVAAVIFCVFIGRQEYDRSHPPAHRASTALVGQTINLPGVQFAPQGKTLILAISTTCHFCKDSEPFYQQLAAKSAGKVKMVAVLPQSLAEAQSYVSKSIASSVQAVSSPLGSISVTGTPTVLLVDGSGKVQKAWVGKLSDQGEKEVQAAMM